MSNFKSGSGDLDFGGSDEDDEETQTTTETSQTHNEGNEDTESTSSEQLTSASSDRESPDTENTSDQPASDHISAGESAASNPSAEKYPYFVRRSNVGDERDTRLEIHVRDKVADQEAKFRNELAEHLGANEVSKTDAREFALLAAFHHPERVAELMRDEGFGTLG
jgi:hypothetical protein